MTTSEDFYKRFVDTDIVKDYTVEEVMHDSKIAMEEYAKYRVEKFQKQMVENDYNLNSSKASEILKKHYDELVKEHDDEDWEKFDENSTSLKMGLDAMKEYAEYCVEKALKEPIEKFL